MPESEANPVLTDAERESVYRALESILATEKFEAAPQMSAFLRYVVEQAADGNQNRIKAFTVAVDALGKPDTFDPQNDPVVRVLAGRLRAALSAYYDENISKNLIITMKPGSYVPAFKQRNKADNTPVDHGATANVVQQHHPTNGSDDTLLKAIEADASTSDSDTGLASVVENTFSEVNKGNSQKEHDSTDSTTHGHSAPATVSGRIKSSLTLLPKPVIAVALIGSLLFALVQYKNKLTGEPGMLAATPFKESNIANAVLDRPRPDGLSVFISAVDKGNALENSLNAVISSTISESPQIKVYRILQNNIETRFWPEDYVLSVSALDLPAETRINMQLMEAVSGRIVHSQVVRLNEQAFEQLTEQELSLLIDSANSIVSETGPLVTDYTAKKITINRL
ncbi:MAG: hypothetical protein AB8B97_19195 [Granulosicoccus sp.]